MSRITATVPALVVVLLRGALYTDLQRTCEDTPATSPEYKTRAGCALPRPPRTLAPAEHLAHAARRLHESHAPDLWDRRGIGALHRPLRRRTRESLDDAPTPGRGEHSQEGKARTMRTWSATIGVMLAVVAWASPAPALAAGSYQVGACNFAPEAANNSWTWATNDPAEPSHYAEHVNCPYRLGGSGGTADQEGGLSTTDALGLSSDAAPGTSADWTFTAPAGTTITGLTYERYIGHSLDPKNSWSPALRADGAIVPEETCLDSVENGETCSVGGPPGTGGEPARITGLSAHELSLGIVCQPPAGRECVTGATQHAVWATMYGATVTLSDPTPPTLSAPSGALWGPGEAGGFHKGTESVAVAAQDVGCGRRWRSRWTSGPSTSAAGCRFEVGCTASTGCRRTSSFTPRRGFRSSLPSTQRQPTSSLSFRMKAGSWSTCCNVEGHAARHALKSLRRA